MHKSIFTVRNIIDANVLTDDQKEQRRIADKRRPKGMPLSFPAQKTTQLRNAGRDVLSGKPIEQVIAKRFSGYRQAHSLNHIQGVLRRFEEVRDKYTSIDFSPLPGRQSIKSPIDGAFVNLGLDSIATMDDGTPLYLYFHVMGSFDRAKRDITLHTAGAVVDELGRKAKIGILDATQSRIQFLDMPVNRHLVEQCIKGAIH